MAAAADSYVASVTESPRRVEAWARYLARTVDLAVVTMPVFLVLALVVGVVSLFTPFPLIDAYLEMPPLAQLVVGTLAVMGVGLLLETVLISMFGGTPGKALMGVRVRTAEGTKLSLGTSLRRAGLVLLVGRGLGLPLVALVTSVASLNRLESKGATFWDERLALAVERRPIGRWRWAVGVAITIAWMLLNVVGSVMG